MTDPKAAPTPQAQAGDGMSDPFYDHDCEVFSGLVDRLRASFPDMPECDGDNVHQDVFSGLHSYISGLKEAQAPARDAGAVAWRLSDTGVWVGRDGYGREVIVMQNDDRDASWSFISPGDNELVARRTADEAKRDAEALCRATSPTPVTHPAAASDDARRLDFLASRLPNQRWTHPSGAGFRLTYDVAEGVRVTLYEDRQPTADELRAAIDAALTPPDGLRPITVQSPE